ncbi:MAG: glycosyltransferase family 2 protein [Parabacteroides merdae]|jgi:glycosyltransferase, family 2|nr:glycosyltransferase family 2 protein [Parabacteroides merdae]
MKKKITIFTPTYNRAHTITRVYDSLLRQDWSLLSEIEWLIVDDGSVDNTESLVSFWKSEKLPFTIRYIKQVNGGKHTAFNRATKESEGEFFFTVDSDDWLADNSIKYIFEMLDRILNAKDIVGIIALKCFPDGKLIGNSYPINCENSSAYNLFLQGYGGERSLVFRTSIIKQYPFPVIKGEYFCTESVVYDQIDLKYKYLVSNHILTVCEYQEDGLTSNIFPLMVQNSVGYKIYYSQRIDMAVSLRERIGYAIRYNAFNLLKKDSIYDYKGKHKLVLWLMFPFGLLAYFYYKLRK